MSVSTSTQFFTSDTKWNTK